MLLFLSVVSSEFASIAHYDGLSTAYECSHNSTIHSYGTGRPISAHREISPCDGRTTGLDTYYY